MNGSTAYYKHLYHFMSVETVQIQTNMRCLKMSLSQAPLLQPDLKIRIALRAPRAKQRATVHRR